jgi:hypothetical protein
MKRTCALLLLAALLPGCAAMTEVECRSADWKDIGQREGITGNIPRIEVYAHQCGKFNVKPDQHAYMEAWTEGYAEWDRRVQVDGCCSTPP